MKYIPNPIDTSKVVLQDNLEQLCELLAKNVHDRWALGRIAEGWKYGEITDAEKKETPCLVEYERLPESEKDFDRITAKETLKVILSLGYTISKKD